MPRFCANLNFLFTEVPLLDRFEAAAKAGFKAVEIGNPYEAPAADIAARLKANGLTLALFNISAGDAAAGERGRSGDRRPRDGFRRRPGDGAALLRPRPAARCIHVMAGLVHQGARRDDLRRQPQEGRAQGRRRRRQPGDRADQPARHPGLLPQQARRRPRRHPRGGRAQPRPAVRSLSPPGRGGRRGRRHQGVRGRSRATTRSPARPTAASPTRAS